MILTCNMTLTLTLTQAAQFCSEVLLYYLKAAMTLRKHRL